MASEELPAAPHTIAEWVNSYEDGGPLRGFRCPACGLITATWGLACPRCAHVGLEEQVLGSTGHVVAFTLLMVPGELDGGGRITGWMPSVRTVNGVAIGTRVRFRPSYKPGVQFASETETVPSVSGA
jgi:uncharacterized OB-fold protein